MYIHVYKIAGDSSKIYSVFYKVLRNTYFCVLFLKFTVQSSSHLPTMGDKGHDNIAYQTDVSEAEKTKQRQQIELNHIESVARNDYTSEKKTNGW